MSVATNSEKTTAEVHLTVFRMAQLPPGCVCLCTDYFVERSCSDYTNCFTCKGNCPPAKKYLSLKNSKGKQSSTNNKPNEDKSHLKFFMDKENDLRLKFLIEANFKKCR